MIRFIDLQKQIFAAELNDPEPRSFAFYNTVTDRFLDLDGDQTWHTWEEFVESYACCTRGVGYPLDRFAALFPESWPNLAPSALVSIAAEVAKAKGVDPEGMKTHMAGCEPEGIFGV